MDPPPPDFHIDPRVRDSTEFKLIEAAVFGDLHRFKRLAKMLDLGRGRLREAVEAVQGAPGMDGLAALHAAAASNAMGICKYLVETLQVDVDVADGKGKTPLFVAVSGGHLDLAKYLLDHYADPDKATQFGVAPLHVAAGFGHCEILKLLLAKGAYVDPISIYGTPLHIAATEGQDGTMKILLEHDAECNMMVSGRTPLSVAMAASKGNSEKCVKLLLEAGADVDGDDSSESTDLRDHHAYDDAAEYLNSLWEQEEEAANLHAHDDVKPVDGRKIAELKSLGSKAVEKKDYYSAEGFYSKAMDLDPNDATLLANRSLCWLRIGDGGKALLDAHECRNKRPDWPKSYYRQGAALMLLKDYVSACEAFFDGFKLDPGNDEIENALREALGSLMTSQST